MRKIILVTLFCAMLYAALGCSSCFPANTLILMADRSKKKIEDVKVGDMVMGFDGKKKVPVKVLELEAPLRDHMYTLHFEDGTKLELTKEHPLYTKEGWKSISPEATAEENVQLKVGELKVGDKVLNSKGEYIKMVKIDYVEKAVRTYNLKRVSDHNNFFANGFLAHNKGPVPVPPLPNPGPSLLLEEICDGYEHSGTNVNVTATDDDGIGYVQFWYRKVGADNWNKITLTGSGESYSSGPINLKSGIYEIKIVAKDNLDNENETQTETFERWANEINSDEKIENILNARKGSTIDDFLIDPGGGDYELEAPDGSMEFVDAAAVINGKAVPVFYKGEMDGDKLQRLKEKFDNVIYIPPCPADKIEEYFDAELSKIIN